MKVESSRYMRSAVGESDFLRDGLPQVAFAGRSNVGKSSLLNRLLGRRALARISSTPGRTRAINYFLINSKFYFVDLPGYGYAKVGKDERRKWAEMIESYLNEIDEQGMVVQLVDAKVGATPLDEQAFDYLESLGLEPIVVATKADQVSSTRRSAAERQIRQALGLDEEDTLIPFSSRSGEGIAALWKEIDNHVQPSKD